MTRGGAMDPSLVAFLLEVTLEVTLERGSNGRGARAGRR